MTLFVDGLDLTIRSLVPRRREETPRADPTFQGLVHFAQNKGDPQRARSRPRTGAAAPIFARPRDSQDRHGSTAPATRTSPSLLAESSVEFRDTSAAGGRKGNPPDDELQLLHLYSSAATSAIPTDSVPMQAETSDTDAALAIGPRHFPAPKLPLQEYTPHMQQARPGWQERCPVSPRPRAGLVCPACYV